MSTFNAKILTPEGAFFEGEATEICMPLSGSFEVKYNHAPIVSTLSRRSCCCTDSGEQLFTISGGMVEMV